MIGRRGMEGPAQPGPEWAIAPSLPHPKVRQPPVPVDPSLRPRFRQIPHPAYRVRILAMARSIAGPSFCAPPPSLCSTTFGPSPPFGICQPIESGGSRGRPRVYQRH